MIDYVSSNWEQIVALALAAHALASAITAMTPTPKDDRMLAKVYKIIEVVALVVGRAKDGGGKTK